MELDQEIVDGFGRPGHIGSSVISTKAKISAASIDAFSIQPSKPEPGTHEPPVPRRREFHADPRAASVLEAGMGRRTLGHREREGRGHGAGGDLRTAHRLVHETPPTLP